MSDNNKAEQKKTSLSLKAASFIPKNLKSNPSHEYTPPTHEKGKVQLSPEMLLLARKADSKTPENTINCNPTGFGMLPGQDQGGMGKRSPGLMPFPSLIAAPPMDLNKMLPFAPMKPPPLLFSQPENLIFPASPNPNLLCLNQRKIGKFDNTKYSVDYILSFKDKYRDPPKDMKPLELPNKLTKKKRNDSEEGELKFFRKKERKYSNFKTREGKFKGPRKMTSK